MVKEIKVFLGIPHRLKNDKNRLIRKIESISMYDKIKFKVLCAANDSPQTGVSKDQIFNRNIELIKSSDIFVAYLINYGKDLTAEVGMSYAWDMPRVGIGPINHKDIEKDVMSYYSLQKIISEGELEDFFSMIINNLYNFLGKNKIDKSELKSFILNLLG